MPTKLKSTVTPELDATTEAIIKETGASMNALVPGELKAIQATAPLVPAENGTTFMIGSIIVPDQKAALDLMTNTAELLRDMMEKQKLYTTFTTRDRRSGAETQHHHPHVEAWQSLAMLLGCTIRELSSVYNQELNGFESIVEVIRLTDGMRIGLGSAFCDFSEPGKEKIYAAKSMATTRAINKATKNQWGHIMKIAGFSPTPKEEIEDEDGTLISGFTKAESSKTPPTTLAAMDLVEKAQDEIVNVGLALHLTQEEVGEIFAQTFGDDTPELPSGKDIYLYTLHLAVKKGGPVTREEVAAFMLLPENKLF